MFRFQTPLIAFFVLVSLGIDFNQASFAQVNSPIPSTSTKKTTRKNRTLSLDQAIAIAEENNEELKIARLQIETAEEGLKIARSGKYPTVNASGRLFRADNSNFNPQPFQALQTAQQAQVQQQTAFNAAQQRQLAQIEFQEQLQSLQIQLQNTGLAQEDTVDQQLNELVNRANNSAILPGTTPQTPLPRFSGISPTNSLAFNNTIENTLEGDVRLDYNILTGGGRSAGIRQAKKQLESAKLDVTRQSRDLQLTVTNGYYDLQEVRALLQVALSAVTSAEQTLNNTILTEEAGLSTKFEVLQAEVQLASARQNLTLAESLQFTAQRQLGEILSLDENMNIVPTDAVDPSGDWPTSLAESIVTAQNNRLELEQILLSRDIQKEERTIVRAVKRPVLSTFAQLSARASDEEPGSNPAAPNEDNFQGSLGYSVGLQVDVNSIFDGRETKAEIKEINENIESLETQYDNQKNEIRVAVESGFYSLEQNRENIRTSQEAEIVAQESLELARLRLKAGIGTQLDVIQAESDLTQAEGNVISAILDYNRAIASISRATAYQIPVEAYSGSSPQKPTPTAPNVFFPADPLPLPTPEAAPQE